MGRGEAEALSKVVEIMLGAMIARGWPERAGMSCEQFARRFGLSFDRTPLIGPPSTVSDQPKAAISYHPKSGHLRVPTTILRDNNHGGADGAVLTFDLGDWLKYNYSMLENYSGQDKIWRVQLVRTGDPRR